MGFTNALCGLPLERPNVRLPISGVTDVTEFCPEDIDSVSEISRFEGVCGVPASDVLLDADLEEDRGVVNKLFGCKPEEYSEV